MSDRDLILTLAKVIIAAAWADGEMTEAEINSLKWLLFRLPKTGREHGLELTQREWAMLEMYIESPIEAAERDLLVKQLQSALRTPQDRELAISTLEDVIQADGVVTEEEQAVAAEIKAALEAEGLGLVARLGRLVRGAVSTSAAQREAYLEDFINNKVYYVLQRRSNLGQAELNIPEADLRKLSLAGALMAYVAHIDGEVTAGEFDQMVETLQTSWDINLDAATFVAEVAVSEIDPGLDHFRLTQELANSTNMEERTRFLEVLFAVADADGGISHQETEEIRSIANGLLLSHKQFIEAKLKISRQ